MCTNAQNFNFITTYRSEVKTKITHIILPLFFCSKYIFCITGGVCKRHGASVKICSHEGCTNQSIRDGVCIKHGAKRASAKTCSHEGCTSIAKKGGVCVRHGATPYRYICSHEGCTKHARKGGVCILHGAHVKPCTHEGCPNQAVRAGFCKRHKAEM